MGVKSLLLAKYKRVSNLYCWQYIKGCQIFIVGNIGKSSGRVKQLVKNKGLIPFTLDAWD